MTTQLSCMKSTSEFPQVTAAAHEFEGIAEMHMIKICHTISKVRGDKGHNSRQLISTHLYVHLIHDHIHSEKTGLKCLWTYHTSKYSNNLAQTTTLKSGLKALLTQSVKTITVQPGPSCSILPGRHINAAILNHVSWRTSNDYWAPAYFNINSLEAGIGGREVEGESAAAGRILSALWLRPLCFIEAIFQCLLWQHLRLLNCRLQGKSERGREKVRERESDHVRKKRREDRWRLERERKND